MKKHYWILGPLVLGLGWLVFTNLDYPKSQQVMGVGEIPPHLVQEFQRKREAREKLIQQDPAFFAAVSAAIFKADPMGINYKTNTEEYDFETGDLILKLKDCRSAEGVAEALQKIFAGAFDSSSAGPKSRYLTLAGEIWELWQKKQSASGTKDS